LIAFIGSVFSPYYARARQRGSADPENHCALNVALYGPAGDRWALTERGRTSLARDATHLSIGPSALEWNGAALEVTINEVTSPLPSRIRGKVRLHAEALAGLGLALDARGRHEWTPIAPCARVEVELESPGLRWNGSGYFDANAGREPLEEGFRGWTWARAGSGREAAVIYDVERRDGSSQALALQFDCHGAVDTFPAPAPTALESTRWWQIPRQVRSEGGQAEIVRTLEDTPFYARSLVRSTLCGRPQICVHESLSLDRFSRPWVRALLPFRMPRRTNR